MRTLNQIKKKTKIKQINTLKITHKNKKCHQNDKKNIPWGSDGAIVTRAWHWLPSDVEFAGTR